MSAEKDNKLWKWRCPIGATWPLVSIREIYRFIEQPNSCSTLLHKTVFCTKHAYHIIKLGILLC